MNKWGTPWDRDSVTVTGHSLYPHLVARAHIHWTCSQGECIEARGEEGRGKVGLSGNAGLGTALLVRQGAWEARKLGLPDWWFSSPRGSA